MQSVHKFLFDTSFDQARPGTPKAAPKPAPSEFRYSMADLAAAREEGLAAGREAGAAEARATIEQTAARALEAIAASLPPLIAARADAERAFVRTAIETATAIVRKLHPELARRHGLTEVEGVLSRCLEGLRNEPRLVVRVGDGLLDALRTRLEPLTGSLGFEGRVALLADETIALGDCRVEWADGGVERNSAALWDDIEAAVGRALADLPSSGPAPQEPAAAGPGDDADQRTDAAAEERSEQA